MAGAMIISSVVGVLLKKLCTPAFKEISSIWSLQTHIEDLTRTVDGVEAVLLDAEEKQSRDEKISIWLQNLQEAFYDAEDLLDEIVTAAEMRMQILSGYDYQVIGEGCVFASSHNQLSFAFTVHRKIKKIRKKFDAIAKDCHDLGLRKRAHHKPKDEQTTDGTHSFVHPKEVVGREYDAEEIIEKLVSSEPNGDDNHTIPVLSIVGIGGMGKTTLSRLVFNNPRIQGHFELTLWVHVGQNFDVKSIMCSMLDLEYAPTINLEVLRVREKINNKKYLLVLDNVWNEDRYDWLQLRRFLLGGAKESRILVTTRSLQVAKIMDDSFPFELKCLSDEHALSLLIETAFTSKEVEDRSPAADLVEIGKEIVKKCANVPLAVKMVGCILYGEDKNRWLSIRDTDLTNISEKWEEKVMYVLRLSYNHLSSPLKRCFSYCALYPKNFLISKERLSGIWMANGCIITSPPCDSRRFEDVCDEYHKILRQRGFFQEHEEIEGGVYFKVHDLVYDLAKDIVGDEIKLVDRDTRQLSRRVLHISLDCHRKINQFRSYAFEAKKLRTFINHRTQFKYHPITKVVPVDDFISGYRYLRLLDLQACCLRSLPYSIGSLALLRYLNLSYNHGIQMLPESVTNLWNLQSLLLASCSKLKELPKGLPRLVNLWRLNVSDCNALTHMPSGIGNLTNLCMLGMFVVGSKLKKNVARLKELNTLKNLNGTLKIKFHAKSALDLIEDHCLEEEATSCMTSLEKLSTLEIEFSVHQDTGGNSREDEAVLVKLQPHPKLKKFKLSGYGGDSFPRWVPNIMHDIAFVLPNLVSLSVHGALRCQSLPALSKLPCLKTLELCNLPSLEYMEVECKNLNNVTVSPSQLPSLSTAATTLTVFFPILEILSLKELPKLKRWWRESVIQPDANDDDDDKLLLQMPSFPRLSKLYIEKCPDLISLPFTVCMLQELSLVKINKNLSITRAATQTTSSLTSSLRSFGTDDVHLFTNISWKVLLGGLLSLRLELCDETLSCPSSTITTNQDAVTAIDSLPVSLEILQLISCPKMSSIPKGLCHLKLLKELVIFSCSSFVGQDEEEGEGPWKDFRCLEYLEFYDLPQLAKLPVGVQHITTLQKLSIIKCPILKEIPGYIGTRIYLNRLIIRKCPLLVRRCKEPTGEDWPKIQHVPYLFAP